MWSSSDRQFSRNRLSSFCFAARESSASRTTAHCGLRLGLMTITCLLASGCREHPKVTSRESQDLIKQFYTACNTRNIERLNECQTKLQQLETEGAISPAESESFNRILQQARAGDWSNAQANSLQFARDQVR